MAPVPKGREPECLEPKRFEGFRLNLPLSNPLEGPPPELVPHAVLG